MSQHKRIEGDSSAERKVIITANDVKEISSANALLQLVREKIQRKFPEIITKGQFPTQQELCVNDKEDRELPTLGLAEELVRLISERLKVNVSFSDKVLKILREKGISCADLHTAREDFGSK